MPVPLHPTCVRREAANTLEKTSSIGRYVRVSRFLRDNVASRSNEALLRCLEYERVDYAGLTLQWRGARQIGEVYNGALLWKSAPHACAFDAMSVLSTPWFVANLARIVGEPLYLMRDPTPYMLRMGDRIALHDDMSDSRHRVSAVINLTRDMSTLDAGGKTVIGSVADVVDVPTPVDVPFQLREWRLQDGYDELATEYNSLTLLRLSRDLAHGVQPVLQDVVRLSVVAIYGTD